MKRLRVGILGFGNVGGSFIGLLQGGHFADFTLQIVSVVNRHKRRHGEFRDASGQLEKRVITLPDELITTESGTVCRNPGVDVIVDATAANTTEMLICAMTAGKHVVSANKKYVARDGARLKAAAQAAGVSFLCEATVMC